MQLHYKKYGEQGPPIVILHGLLGSLDNWHTIAKKLSSDYTIYTVDQRNHGRSPHAPEHNYPVMAEDLHDFLDQHQLEKALILGHSMGGKTAMWFAVNHPERTDAMISVDMAPRQYTEGHEDILEVLNAFPIEKIESRRQADEWMSKQVENFAIRQFLLKNLERDEEGGYRWKMNLPVITEQYERMGDPLPEESSFQKPALFIRGERSDYIRKEDEGQIQRQFPEARVETVPEAGHWVHAEVPEEFLKELRAFLQETLN